MTLSARRVLSRARVPLEFFEWPGRRSFRSAWMECPRGDWLLHLAAILRIDRRILVRTAVECVRPAMARADPGMESHARTLDVALAWCDGRATAPEVWRATIEAMPSGRLLGSGASAAVAQAADAAWAAASAVEMGTMASVAVAWAAEAVATAAAPWAKDEARAAFLLGAAETVRRIIPFDLVAGPAEALRLTP